MSDDKVKYTREETSKVFSKISSNIQTKKKWWNWTEVVTMFSGILVAFFSSISLEFIQSKEMFEQILKKSNLLTDALVLGLTVILIIFMPSLFKRLITRNNRQDISLKKRVIKTYLEQLDKTIINPSPTTNYE